MELAAGDPSPDTLDDTELGTRAVGARGAPWIRRAVRVIAILISLAVVAALVGVVRRDGPAAVLVWRTSHVQWVWIALASGCALAGQLVYVLGWRRLLADCGVALSVWQAVRIFLASNLGRYLPGGKAWQMGIVGVMATERGLPAAILAATSLLQGIVGVVVGALLLVVTGGAALGVSASWLVVPGLGVVSLLVTPMVLRWWPRAYALVVGRWPSIASITSATMWTLLWTSVVNWLAWGAGLYMLACGLLTQPGASLSAYVAAWIGPFIAGIVAVIAPAGLGVRDAAMTAILKAAGENAGGTVVVVVVARLWGTLLEVVPAIAVLLMQRGRRAECAVNLQPNLNQ